MQFVCITIALSFIERFIVYFRISVLILIVLLQENIENATAELNKTIALCST